MIGEYPEFSALALEQRPALHPRFQRLAEGMSELTFAGLYLFRETHRYRISRVAEDIFVISGQDARPFFMLPFGLPPGELLNSLFERFGLMKAVSPAQAHRLAQMGYHVWEDRDNFDYLYSREKLASLSGRKLHRKKNLVNLFLRNNVCMARPLLEEYVADALRVLDRWRQQQEMAAGDFGLEPTIGSNPPSTTRQPQSGASQLQMTEDGVALNPQSAIGNPQSAGPGDYAAAREALEHMEYLQLCGGIFYVDDEPVAYTLGEELARGKMFVIHFEKAVLRKEYKGVYQYVNQAFAALLPEKYELINREQDLGDPGLRQAKESYRPVGFVAKYRAALKGPG